MESEYGKLGALLIEGLQEAIAIEAGEAAEGRARRVAVTARKAYVELPPWYPPHLIREIRHRLSVSQAIFAQMFGVSVSTVRAWEQGKREPEGPARRLMQIADHHVDVFREACGEIHPAARAKRPLPRALSAPQTDEARLAADTDAS